MSVGVRDARIDVIRGLSILLVLLLVAVNALALSGVPIFCNHPESGGPVPLWLVDVASLTFWDPVGDRRADLATDAPGRRGRLPLCLSVLLAVLIGRCYCEPLNLWLRTESRESPDRVAA